MERIGRLATQIKDLWAELEIVHESQEQLRRAAAGDPATLASIEGVLSGFAAREAAGTARLQEMRRELYTLERQAYRN